MLAPFDSRSYTDVPGMCFTDAATVDGSASGRAGYVTDSSGRGYVQVSVSYRGEVPPAVRAVIANVYCLSSETVCTVSEREGFQTCELPEYCLPEHLELHVRINE